MMTTNNSIQAVVSKDFIYRGSDVFLYFVFANDQNERIDITGDDFWLTLAAAKDQRLPNLQIKYTAPANAKSTNGELLMHIPNTETKKLFQGSYYFDLRRFVTVSQNTYKTTLEHGKVRIFDQIGRL